jgi:hypothetical protein
MLGPTLASCLAPNPFLFLIGKAFKKKATQKGNLAWDSDLLQLSTKNKTKEKEERKLVENSFILCCTHGNERMVTHYVVHDTFVAMARDVDFHVGQEQLYTFPSTTFHSFCQ